MNESKNKSLTEILIDNVSGSVDITSEVNELFKKNYNDIPFLKKALQQLKKKRTPFQSLNSYLNEVQKIIIKGNKTELKNLLQNYGKNKFSGYKAIYQNSKPLLKNKNKIVTISNSRTVLEFLKLLHRNNKKLEVYITESRPVNEGRELAKSLLKNGIKVTFVTDFNIASSITETDAVITGADSILKNGDVINKTGSRAAAIISRYLRKPFYVLAASDKFSNKKIFKPDEKNPGEIWNYKHKKLKVRNTYFEVIERKLITKIISEQKQRKHEI